MVRGGRQRRWVRGAGSFSHSALRLRTGLFPRGSVGFGGQQRAGQLLQLYDAVLDHLLNPGVLLGVAEFAHCERAARVFQSEVLAQAPLARLRIVAECTSATAQHRKISTSSAD